MSRRPGRPRRPQGVPPAQRSQRPPRNPSVARGVGGEQVEGRQAVRELLRAGRRRVRDVWIVEGADQAAILDEIADLAAAARVPVRWVGRGQLEAEARTDAPQGVLAHADPLPVADFDRLCEGKGGEGRSPFLVVLDGVTDPHNLGALLRSAVGAGATGAVLARHRAVHVTPAVTKSAAGAIEWLPLAIVPGIPAALVRARELGVWSVGLDERGETSLFDFPLASEPVALVLGAEGAGLARLTRDRCDMLVRVPLTGPLASLNVAVAGSLACFEIARRRTG